jgi:hypothetical protein
VQAIGHWHHSPAIERFSRNSHSSFARGAR